MNRAQKIIQAYRNTPWRREAQLIGVFAAFCLVGALVLIAYIQVTSLRGTYGLQVREIQATSQAVEQNIEDQRAQLAQLTSTDHLSERANELGFVPVEPNAADYLVVPGYPDESQARLDLYSIEDLQTDDGVQLPATFTTSLIDWLREEIYQLSLKTGASGLGGE